MEQDEDQRVGLGRAIETLRLPHFAPLFSSNFVQAFYGQVMMMAMQWLTIDQLTEERTLYFIIPFLQGGVAALLSPFAGVVADRVAKRSLLITGRLLLVVIVVSMGMLVWTGLVTLTHVYVASVIGGVVSAMMQPAGQTFIFDVVGRERVENAISLNATASGLAQVGGPLAAGAMLAVIGVAGSFFVGGAGLFMSACLLMAIPIAGKVVETVEATSAGADLRAGFAWVWRDAPVRLVMLGCTMAIFNGALGPMRAIYAKFVLDVGTTGLGWMGAAGGAGTILAALWLASMRSFPRPGVWIIGSLWAYALCLVLYAFAFSFEWILAVEFLAGISGQVWTVTVMAGLQLAVPENMRGRVVGMVFTVAQLGFIGQPVMGLLADRIGDQWALGLFGAIPSVVLAAVLVFGMKRLRQVGHTHLAEA
ncbi:MAG: MFS transporter [Myxococcota bacterium]